MKFGAHISTAKPFSDAVSRAESIGCESMQIFVSPPQRWNPLQISESEIKKYYDNNKKAQIPTIIHSIYLINLASENPFYYSQSIASLIDSMNKAKLIGALGVNTHLGSTKGKDFTESLPKVVNAIKEILTTTDPSTFFIIENSAGAGNIIGDTLEEIAAIINEVKSDRVKVLIDTAHAFESGYNLSLKSDIDLFIEKFDKIIGLDKLIGFHLNDSKTALNSKRDRHADIGHGGLGVKAFKDLINHPKISQMKELLGILETPQDEIDWSTQLKILKGLEAR